MSIKLNTRICMRNFSVCACTSNNCVSYHIASNIWNQNAQNIVAMFHKTWLQCTKIQLELTLHFNGHDVNIHNTTEFRSSSCIEVLKLTVRSMITIIGV